MNTDTTLLLTNEAAYILKVAPDTVRYLERTGHLPALKTSTGVRLFDRRDVESLRLARERQAAAREAVPSKTAVSV